MRNEKGKVRGGWAYVTKLDVTPLYAGLRSVEGHAGRDIADRRVYLALWLYATLRGVGAARELERLCERHVDYQWICGGVPVNYHTLADFRTEHGEFLDRLLTESVATLMHEGLVELHRVAHDGLRVRASAGTGSYRRRESLQKCLAEAQEQVQRLREELDADPRAAAVPRAGSAQSPSGRTVVCLGPQRDAGGDTARCGGDGSHISNQTGG